MSDHIRCPNCGTEIEIKAAQIELQTELPLGPIELTLKNNLDTQGTKSHAERPATRFDSVRLSSSLSLTESDSNRIVQSPIASCEEDLIASIREIVGGKEWTAHAPL